MYEYTNINNVCVSYEPNVKAELTSTSALTWSWFNSVVNEMIITRSGRKMFPVVVVRVAGLVPSAMYSFILQFKQLGNQKYRYMNREWSCGGRQQKEHSKNYFCHGNSPNYGHFWLSDEISFTNLKLTNKETEHHQVKLNSLHKYEPVLKVLRVGEGGHLHLVYERTFPECEFIAVTAYQNEEVTALKILHNPFAKAFLENRGEKTSKKQDQCIIQKQLQEIIAFHQNNPYAYNQVGLPRLNTSSRHPHPHRALPYASPSASASRSHDANNPRNDVNVYVWNGRCEEKKYLSVFSRENSQVPQSVPSTSSVNQRLSFPGYVQAQPSLSPYGRPLTYPPESAHSYSSYSGPDYTESLTPIHSTENYNIGQAVAQNVADKIHLDMISPHNAPTNPTLEQDKHSPVNLHISNHANQSNNTHFQNYHPPNYYPIVHGNFDSSGNYVNPILYQNVHDQSHLYNGLQVNNGLQVTEYATQCNY